MSYHFPDGTGAQGAEIRKTADIIGFGMLLLFAGSIFTRQILAFFTTLLFSSASVAGLEILNEMAALISYIVSMALPAAAITLFTRTPVRAAFPMKPPGFLLLVNGILFCLGTSVLGGLLSRLVSLFVQAASGYAPVMPDMDLPSGSISIFVYILNVVAAPAFLEEILFRGAVLQTLRRFGDGFALLTSSILFAAAHGNLVQGPNSFIMGIVIGYFVLRTESLWSGVAIHFINNFIVVAFEIAMRRSSASDYRIAALELTWAYVACGVSALVLILAKYPGFFRFPPPSQGFGMKRYVLFFTSIMPLITLAASVYITSTYLIPL